MQANELILCRHDQELKDLQNDTAALYDRIEESKHSMVIQANDEELLKKCDLMQEQVAALKVEVEHYKLLLADMSMKLDLLMKPEMKAIFEQKRSLMTTDQLSTKIEAQAKALSLGKRKGPHLN